MLSVPFAVAVEQRTIKARCSMPYESMIRKLQVRLNASKDKQEREYLEIAISVLLLQMELKKQLEQFTEFLTKK